MDVHLQGNPTNRYFKLGPIHARRLGLEPHPGFPHALVLAEEDWNGTGAVDANALLHLPNGQCFTAEELTTLSHKSGDPVRGWEIWADDPGGYPSWELPDPMEVTA